MRMDDHIPAQRVRPPEMRSEPTMLATGETKKKLHNEQFMVPGAPDYRVLGASKIVVVLNALNFFIVPGALLCQSTTD